MLTETLRERRGHDFYPPAEERDAMPPLYGAESTPADDKIVRLHYFVGSADWWIVEADWTTGIAFGFCDLGFGEWGYASLVELESIHIPERLLIVERDLHWQPTRWADVALSRG